MTDDALARRRQWKLDRPREARRHLEVMLDRASQAFASGDQRNGANAALNAVCEFLQTTRSKYGRNNVVPLRELGYALSDAERGLSNPLTQPNEYEGGSRKRIEDALKMVRGAATVSFLLSDANESLSAATQKVARAMGPGLSASQITNFRKELLSGRAAPEFVWMYEHWLDTLRTVSLSPEPTPPAERAKQFLRSLQNSST